MSAALQILLVLLPQSLKRLVARRLLGWEIHPTAHLGRSLIRVGRLTMGPGASIGPWNVIKDLDEVHLAEGASIATRNTITGIPSSSGVFTHSPNRRPALVMGRFSMITNAHDIDCSDLVELADHAVLAGFRSQILTHSLNLVQDRFVTGPVRLGEHCAVMSGCTILSGMQVPDRSVVSAGSVITTRLTAEHTFYRGNPAEAVRDLPPTLKYFHREGLQHQVAAEIEAWQAARSARSR